MSDLFISQKSKQEYSFPPVSLLTSREVKIDDSIQQEIDSIGEQLVSLLRKLGIAVQLINVSAGLTVTRYELKLVSAIRVSKLANLSEHIEMNLALDNVRVEMPVPNKPGVMHIEIPNRKRMVLGLREVIESTEFKDAPSKLTFAIGKNVSGEAVVGNLTKLSHLLVSGITGSGKSVCLNSLILSILYKATPDEVRLIMVDPKMVELGNYNGIPHLLIPVVTDPKKAVGVLQWAATEMMKRYRIFSEVGVHNLEEYNALADRTEGMKRMPFIVVIIDELADLMLVAAKEVEKSVCRVAQMGRAAGIHLVIATQSPRTEIITGPMKASIPSRIALKVSSALESRMILGAGGNADKLVGNGDMLFVPVDADNPIRVQGAWVSDKEREQIIEFIKTSSDIEPECSQETIEYMDKVAEEKSTEKQAAEPSEDEQYDELLSKAVEVILESEATVSMLQRRLKLGYGRAARLMDEMEEKGIVGSYEGSKPRKILVSKEDLPKYLTGTAGKIENSEK